MRRPQPSVEIGLDVGVGVVEESVPDHEPHGEHTEHHTGDVRHDSKAHQCAGQLLHVPNLDHGIDHDTSEVKGGSAPARWHVMPATVMPNSAAAITLSTSLNSSRPQACRTQ